MRTIKEGSAEVFVPKEKKISKDLPVFYNPRMKLNRDFTVLLLNSIEKEDMKMADILAGTGIRAVRLLKELEPGKIKSILVNDYDEKAAELIRKNLERNNLLGDERVNILEKEANVALMMPGGYDYIDIDPFGSPNPFLNSAVKKLARGGILAVTATDTAALSGSSPAAGRRKYFAENENNYLMHESGIRILARKVQLIGAEHEKALIPVFSYAFEHYYRIFFIYATGKGKVDEVLLQHKFLLFCGDCGNNYPSEKNLAMCCGKEMLALGPMYCGNLFDGSLIKRMKNNLDIDDREHREMVKILSTADEEAKQNRVGFYDLHELSENLKISVPKYGRVMNTLREKGFYARRTIFSERGIKTDAGIDIIKECLLL